MSKRTSAAMFAALVATLGCAPDAPMDLALDPGVMVQTPSLERAATDEPPPSADRKLIQTGTTSLEVDDLPATITALRGLAAAANGFVAGSNVREGTAGARSGSVTLRVPASAFEETRAGVRGLGRVLSSRSESVDVTREYVDLQTRIDVKTETVARLQDLLARTGDLEDLLAVERELGRATTELESQKGQLQYLERQVGLSTLTVEMVEPGSSGAGDVWKPVGDAFRGAGNVFAQSIVVLVYLVVSVFPWAVLAGIIWLILGKVRKRTASRGSAQ